MSLNSFKVLHVILSRPSHVFSGKDHSQYRMFFSTSTCPAQIIELDEILRKNIRKCTASFTCTYWMCHIKW